ncbi:hypothetical protein BH18ACT15_BH18ACT15_04540 [soil metagenome]
MVAAAGAVLAHAAGWGPGGWWPVFPIFWILFWGVVLFVVFRSRRSWGRWNAGQSAEGVLGERYARGEVSEEEYRARLSVLKGTGRQTGRV